MDPGLIPLIVGPVVLIVLIRRGCLRPDALACGPDRRIGLLPFDILIALGLLIVGPVLVLLLLPDLATGSEQAGGEQVVDTFAVACRMLLIQAAGMLTPVLYLLWRSSYTPDGPRRIGLLPRHIGREVRWGLLGFVAAVPLVLMTMQLTVLVGELFGQETPAIAHDTLKMLLESDSIFGTVLLICSAAVVAPVLEECFFRGIVQSVMVETLGEARRWSVVIVASILFAAMHGNNVPWHALPGLCVLGLVLGWLYERTGSLWPSILVHVGFNVLNIVMALTMVKGSQGAL